MQFLLDITADDQPGSLADLFVLKPEIDLHLTGNDYEFISWGDPICSETFSAGLQQHRNIDFIVNNLYGHYYYVFLDKNRQQILAGNSLFSIPPLYYHIKGNRVGLSGSVFALGRHTGNTILSKRFLLDSMLFNYPISDHAAIEGISLLSSNSGLVIDRGGVRIIKHTSISDTFGHSPLKINKCAGDIADVFLDSVKKYLPGEEYFTALTGGFDGRTLAAAGRYHKRQFSGYCFGTSASRDLSLARETASKTYIPFFSIELNDDYIINFSLESGRKLILNSSGNATFTRAHYLFAAGLLANKTRYLVSGNFGSEIFRAVHVPGVVISPNLYSIFSSDNPAVAFRKIWSSPVLNWLNQEEMRSVKADLESDIANLPCFSAKYKHLSKNMQFYVFVFEELFRKYFGSEMISQWHILKSRTPFLDIDFLKRLLVTEFAGIHSGFFEGNPFKRYRGQLLYAYIIRQACPDLGKPVTDRGYAPDDLISYSGIPSIIKGYLQKQVVQKGKSYDPLAVMQAWDYNHHYYESLSVNDALFNSKRIYSEKGSGFSNERAKLYSLIFMDDYLNT